VKENGRLAPADKIEHSDLKSKTFKCTKCGAEIPIRNSEFGERRVCPECDLGILEEVV